MAEQYIDPKYVTTVLPALRAGRTGKPVQYTKGGEFAFGSITFADNPTANDTITLNGVVIKFTSGASDFTTAGSVADPYILNIKGTLELTIDEIVTQTNGSANASLSVATYAKSGTTILTINYDTIGTAGNAYTLAASADTVSAATLTGGEATKALSLDSENIDLALTDTRDQYFSLADAPEFTKKVIVLSAKSTGNAIISYNATTTTLSTAGQYLVFQFLDGDWRSLVDPTISAINDLAVTDGNFIVGNGSTWVTETGNTVLASIGTTSTTTELNYLDLTTGPGTQEASKAVVADANVNTGVSKVTELHIGASGSETQVTATADEINSAADLSVNGALVKVKKIALTAAGDTNENDTTFDLPAKSVVLDVFLDVTTAEATATTKTMNVGLLSSEGGGDADGFAVGISTASTGVVRPQATVTTGASEVYFSATTRGAFLANFTAGTDAATDVGTNYEFPHLSTAVTAKSVSWTAGEAQTEFAGDLYITYMEIA